MAAYFFCNELVTYPPIWEDERGFLKTAQCAVLPREMSERISKARTAPEAVVYLATAEKVVAGFQKIKQSTQCGLFYF